MTWEELNKAYTYFQVDSHPDSFGIRNNPGSLAFYETIYRLPDTLAPHAEQSLMEDGVCVTVKRYRYSNSMQFNEKAANFCWKSIEANGKITYELDLE